MASTTDARHARRLLSVSEIARAWSLTPQYVAQLIRNGELDALKIGTGPKAQWRVQPDALTDFLVRANLPRHTHTENQIWRRCMTPYKNDSERATDEVLASAAEAFDAVSKRTLAGLYARETDEQKLARLRQRANKMLRDHGVEKAPDPMGLPDFPGYFRDLIMVHSGEPARRTDRSRRR